MLRDRRIILSHLGLGLGAVLFGLGACGFEPAYGPGGTGAALYNQVRVVDPGSLDTYLLVRDLEEQLGRGENARFSLSPRMRIFAQGEAVTQSGSITRYALQGSVVYVLRDVRSDAIVYQGQVSSFTTYSAQGTNQQTVAAQRDARVRLIQILADRTVADLVTRAPVPQ